MTYQIPLLLRSRVFRGLLVAVFLVGLAAGGFKSTADALKLSPSQEAEKLLGGADAVVETRAEGSARHGTYPQLPEELADRAAITITTEYSATVDLARGEDARRFRYSESPLPSVISEGRHELLDGTWPARPGECVGSSSTQGEWVSTHQGWGIRVVGEFKEIYSHTEDTVMCAPGTWAERAGQGESTETITATYWIEGPADELRALQGEIGLGGEEQSMSLTLRADLLRPDGVSAQRFLGGYSLVLALLAGIPFVFAGMVARWVRGIQQVLVRSGIRPQVMRRAAMTALLGGAAVLATVGCSIGMITGLGARPLIQLANQGLPLGPWQFSIPWLGQTVLWSVAGALLGFLVLGVFQQVRARLAERAPRPLSPTMATTLGWAGTALVQFATGTLVGGIIEGEPHPYGGWETPRIIGPITEGAWQPLVTTAAPGMTAEPGTLERPDFRGLHSPIAHLLAQANVGEYALGVVHQRLVITVDRIDRIAIAKTSAQIGEHCGVTPKIEVTHRLLAENRRIFGGTCP